MKIRFSVWRMLAVLSVLSLVIASSGAGVSAKPAEQDAPTDPIAKGTAGGAIPSGIYDIKDEIVSGTGLTECPQAGFPPEQPKPLDVRQPDKVEQISNGGNDRRTNTEYSCFPQNETSLAINPRNQRNIVAGANDYRNGTGSSGFYASTNQGQQWYTGIIPFPSVNPPGTTQGYLVSGGDPALVFDRAGIVYYAQIAFNRDDDTNAVTVQRSTNGGFTWSRACIVQGTAACGGPGDPRQPGDGVVSFFHDNDTLPNGSIPFNDKEYIAAGPRPAGVNPQCFDAAHAPVACNPAQVGVDRIYVTWTLFDPSGTSEINLSYSDDQARSWSPRTVISGSAPFCVGGVGSNCSNNQFSTPTVHPVTGLLGVAFENFNTPDENQYLFVRSADGGTTFQGPFFVTPVFDLNFPRAGISGRVDCTARGQQTGRIVYTNNCFRSNAGGNVVVDKRGGAFGDDFYLVISDNRNGTVYSSNADIFLFKSIDGGSTWIGPTRVNNDRSQLTAGTSVDGNSGRDCLRPAGFVGYGGTSANPFAAPCTGDFGADQWWPWVDISDRGDLNIVFFDRRLDPNSTAGEWPTSRAAPIGRPGNYLVWFWGAQCSINDSNATECMAPGAATIPQPTGPIDPGADPVPGQGASYLGPLDNFTISDVPSNFDYTFRAGIFAGDYNNVAVGADNQAWGFWTDARNGRSSRTQAGRNPLCEQSDVFIDGFSANNGGNADKPKKTDALFLVTLCPEAAADK